MKPVGNLHRVWRASRRTISVGSTPVSVDGFHIGMSVKPDGHIIGGPIGKNVNNFVAF
jgi:hypothetical protein